MERLDKFVSNQLCIGRTEAKRLIRIGKVAVDGNVEKNFGTHIDAEKSQITVDGNKVNFNRNIYLLMNKPKGVVCSTDDKRSKTVIDLLPTEFKRKGISPVGRLDKDTTGLLILTDDGDFAHKVISPKHNTVKKYLVEVDGKFSDGIAERFEKGVILADGTRCMPAEIKIINNNGPFACEVSIREGKYHQIKRMFGTENLGVNELKRLSIGNLKLPTELKLGDVRILSEEAKGLVFVENR